MTDKTPEDETADLGEDTVKYLVELAHDSFKRQSELDESVWRSLPFFAATFAFVATIIGRSAVDVPPWDGSFLAYITSSLVVSAVGSLAWALRWFWVVLRRREYEYPAADAEVRTYAEGIAAFHVASGVPADKLDGATLHDMRLFMLDQYGSAAATNLSHNAVKLKARPKALLFILVGFVLAFVCEATIFVRVHVGGPSVAAGAKNDGSTSERTPKGTKAGAGAAEASAPPKVTSCDRGGGFLGSQRETRHTEQAVTNRRTPTPQSSRPSNSAPSRPTPPLSQTIAKDRSIELGRKSSDSSTKKGAPSKDKS